MNRIIVRVWVVVYNPTEVKQLIIVNMLTTWKEHVKKCRTYLM